MKTPVQPVDGFRPILFALRGAHNCCSLVDVSDSLIAIRPPVEELDQHVAVTWPWRTPTTQSFAPQFFE
jgi:hypothetical protein